MNKKYIYLNFYFIINRNYDIIDNQTIQCIISKNPTIGFRSSAFLYRYKINCNDRRSDMIIKIYKILEEYKKRFNFDNYANHNLFNLSFNLLEKMMTNIQNNSMIIFNKTIPRKK